MGRGSYFNIFKDAQQAYLKYPLQPSKAQLKIKQKKPTMKEMAVKHYDGMMLKKEQK